MEINDLNYDARQQEDLEVDDANTTHSYEADQDRSISADELDLSQTGSEVTEVSNARRPRASSDSGRSSTRSPPVASGDGRPSPFKIFGQLPGDLVVIEAELFMDDEQNNEACSR